MQTCFVFGPWNVWLHTVFYKGNVLKITIVVKDCLYNATVLLDVASILLDGLMSFLIQCENGI